MQHFQTHLRPGVGFAYFSCSFDDLGAQDPANIIGSLLAQLSDHVHGIPEEASANFKNVA